jgi:hypothetical protein
MAATVSGEGTLTPNAEVGKTMWATISGEGTLTGSPRMIVVMSAKIDAGVRPSAFDIAQEVWQSQKTAYNAPGTMGSGVNTASTGGVDYAALGEAVWTAASRTLTAGSAPTVEQIAAEIVNDPKFKALLTTAKFLGLK